MSIRNNLKKSRISAILIVLSNFIIGIIAVTNNWEVFDLMWVYVIQTIIITLFFSIKALYYKKFSSVIREVAMLLYFSYLYPIYLLKLNLVERIDADYVLNIIIGSSIFFVSYLLLFIINFKDEKSIMVKKFSFFKRIFPVQLTIIVMAFTLPYFSIFLIDMSKRNIVFIFLFIVAVTVVDIQTENHSNKFD